MYFNFMVQEKVGGEKEEEGPKKWIEIDKDELLKVYREYYL